MRRILLLAGAALALSAVPALGHQSVLSSGGVVSWTHSDHAADPLIGEVACVQNRHGITKCLTHLNRIYHYRSPFPQVAPNPAFAGQTRFFQQTKQWWWETGRVGNKAEPGVCVFDLRPYRSLIVAPDPMPLAPRFFAVACIGQDDTTFKNVNDGSVDGDPIDTSPPPDFIRAPV